MMMRDGDSLKVSIVIPLYNEEKSINSLLVALATQTRTPDEIVCVDAGSDDETSRIVSDFRSDFPVRLISKNRLNPGEARNEGVREAMHEWIAFIDGGTEPLRNWLERLVAAIVDDIEIVYGSYSPLCDTIFRRTVALAYVAAVRSDGWRGPSAASMMMSRSAFMAMGGFPCYRAAEDLIFFEKLAASCFRAAVSSKALVKWDIAATPGALFRKISLYSYVNIGVARGRYWHRGLAIQYLIVMTTLIGAWLLTRDSATLLIVPCWFFARAVKAAWKKRRSFSFKVWNPIYIISAMSVFVIMDIATLYGIMRWLMRWPLVRRS